MAIRRRGGKVRRQFSAETVAKVKAIAAECRSMRELARRVKEEEKLGISHHYLLIIEQDWHIRFPRGSRRNRHPHSRPEFIHPRDPISPGFDRTSPA